MATKNVIFFIVGTKPTTQEQAKIDQLNALTMQPYKVTVMKADVPQSVPVRAADYVAGTSIPTAYSATPVIDPANPPANSLPTNQAVVSNGVALTVPVTGVYATKATPTVVNGVITGIVLS